MAYFLGRDVNVYITNEVTTNFVMTNDATGGLLINTSGTTASNTIFSAPRVSGAVSSGSVSDVTGVDLSIGAVDEDITYFGFRNITKAEIKKETTVSLTRKKSNNSWDAIFQAGRYGIGGSGPTAFAGLEEPTVEHGYRIFVQLKDGTEWIALPNACVSSHTVSFNADGASEETMEFMSYITPLMATSSAGVTGATTTTLL